MINFQEELEKQIKMNSNDGSQQTGKEYKLAEGIYFSDFSKQKDTPAYQSCFQTFQDEQIIKQNQQQQQQKDIFQNEQIYSENNYVVPRQPKILEADFKEFKKRIDKMKESIDEIQEIDNWKDDKDFRDTIENNYEEINNNYKILLDILTILEEQDFNCDTLKNHSKYEIQMQMKENNIQLADFFKIVYGQKENENKIDEESQNNNQLIQSNSLLQQQILQKNEEELSFKVCLANQSDTQIEVEQNKDDILSIQDQLNKQQLESYDNNNEDDGLYL